MIHFYMGKSPRFTFRSSWVLTFFHKLIFLLADCMPYLVYMAFNMSYKLSNSVMLSWTSWTLQAYSNNKPWSHTTLNQNSDLTYLIEIHYRLKKKNQSIYSNGSQNNKQFFTMERCLDYFKACLHCQKPIFFSSNWQIHYVWIKIDKNGLLLVKSWHTSIIHSSIGLKTDQREQGNLA